MPLSTESALTIIGVLINLPPALLIIWKLFKRQRPANGTRSGAIGGRDHDRENRIPLESGYMRMVALMLEGGGLVSRSIGTEGDEEAVES